MGACGTNISPNELSVAMNWEIFDMGREVLHSSLYETWKSEDKAHMAAADGIDHTTSAYCHRGIRVWMGDGEGVSSRGFGCAAGDF
jgi:hypothetical protein